MSQSEPESNTRLIAIVVGAAFVLLLAAFAAFAWVQHRHVTHLEQVVESLRREPVAPSPAPSAPAATPTGEAPIPPPPMMSPGAVRFAVATHIGTGQWAPFRAIQDKWTKAIIIASHDGERALPRPLAELQRERNAALEKLLSPDVLQRLRDYEIRPDVARVRFTAADGHTYEGIEIE